MFFATLNMIYLLDVISFLMVFALKYKFTPKRKVQLLYAHSLVDGKSGVF